MKASDSKIIEAILQGKDENAIGILYQESFRKIRDFIRKNSGSQEDAEDIFQDTVLILYKQIKMGKFNQELELGGFLYTVARNLWINKAKKDQHAVPLLEGFQHASREPLPLLSKEREDFIHYVFGRVGDRCKQLLTLTVYFDHTMKEVCDKMGFPNENAAKTQHYKCKQKLIELMGQNTEFKNLLKNVD
jgi:RNA polymerase sigma factor (sigma-70 family)